MKHAVVVLALLLGCCASFRARPLPQEVDPVIASRSDYSMDMKFKYTIVVRAEKPAHPYCSLPDAGNEIVCEFSMEYLETGALAETGNDWKGLTPAGARKMCMRAMFPTLYNIATGYDVQTCSTTLQYIRFRDLPPDETPKENQ